MIFIDKNKLEQVVLNEMSDLENSPFISGEVCIYQDCDLQVSIKVTKDKDEFFDSVSVDYVCISEKPKEEIKPFDITQHEWSDCELSFNCIDFDGDIKLWCKDVDDELFINKNDAIAIAKHFKLTAEDLK